MYFCQVKRILITGAAGFLGSHLCDRFWEEGFEVLAMDNLLTGRMENLEHLIGRPRFVFYHYDVTQYVHIPGPLDYILHFASPASPADYLRMPIQTLKVGSLGTHKLLGLARAKGATILLASTSEVYGDPQKHPQDESYWGNVNPIGVRGVYDEAKRFLEAMAMAYHRAHGVSIRIARIFNTYGPRMRLDDGRVLPNFIGQALRHEPLTIYGDGSQTRSFCYVSDLIEGIFHLLFVNYPYPVNLGNPEEITIKEFAQEILSLLPESRSTLTYLPLPEDDPKIRKPDISLARKLLGWEPKVSRKEGLRRTLDYFRQYIYAT